jgi:hypothetical protein
MAAKHARAVERLRVTLETLEAVDSLLSEVEGTAEKLGLELLARERVRLAEAIEALQ